MMFIPRSTLIILSSNPKTTTKLITHTTIKPLNKTSINEDQEIIDQNNSSNNYSNNITEEGNFDNMNEESFKDLQDNMEDIIHDFHSFKLSQDNNF